MCPQHITGEPDPASQEKAGKGDGANQHPWEKAAGTAGAALHPNAQSSRQPGQRNSRSSPGPLPPHAVQG